jgi:hypothetical protein
MCIAIQNCNSPYDAKFGQILIICLRTYRAVCLMFPVLQFLTIRSDHAGLGYILKESIYFLV